MDRINVTQSSMPSYEEYIEEIRDIWDSKWLTNMGKKHELLQKKLQDYLGVENVMLCVNGHSALEVALQSEELQGEIITTPFTFISTTNAIIRSGCTPVFCDVKPDTYTIDPDLIESLITERTVAIMAVHVYGLVCDVEKIAKIAEKYKLKVIYDAAHAFGVKYKGQGLASYGDISTFSFHATKVYNTIEGGAVCFNNASLKDKITKIRDFGIKDSENVDYVGPNAKMNEFCAAMGLCNLRHVDSEINKRKNVYLRYIKNLKDVKGIKLPILQDDVQMNYAYFPVIINENEYGINRDELCAILAKNNIFARKYFYPLTNQFECVLKYCEKGNTPVAEYITQRVITLPMYADLKLEFVDRICEMVKKYEKK